MLMCIPCRDPPTRHLAVVACQLSAVPGVQALLREKALNTGELLKQHRDLQQKLQLTQEELAKETRAREGAAKEVQATKQAVAAATRQDSQSCTSKQIS
jgi:hypothetical protein